MSEVIRCGRVAAHITLTPAPLEAVSKEGTYYGKISKQEVWTPWV